MKYKKGSKLYVVNNIHGHHFEIGEQVTVTRKTNIDYQCSNGKAMWWMTDEELNLHPNSTPPSRPSDADTHNMNA